MTHWLDKLWESNIVYDEPICFSESDHSDFIGGSLLYTPTEILKISSSDGTRQYERNKDFQWTSIRSPGQKTVLSPSYPEAFTT